MMKTNEAFVKITADDYKNLLDKRRANIEKWFNWVIPDLVWDYFMEYIDDGCMEYADPEHTTPNYVVDNLAVNGSYGDFDNYKKEGETDEEFIERAEDEALVVFEKERFVIYSL